VLLLKRDRELRKRLAAGARRAFEEKFEFSRGIGEIRRLTNPSRDKRPGTQYRINTWTLTFSYLSISRHTRQAFGPLLETYD